MSGIVQQKSGVATSATSISVTFDSNVAKGNLLIAAIFTSNTNPSSVGDGTEPSSMDGNSYYTALERNPAGTFVFNMYYAKAGASGPITITVNLGGSDTIHLHIFEVAGGYDTWEVAGANYNASNSLNGTVSTDSPTTHADSFVLAMFADTFGSGVTWTPGAGFTAGQTTSGGHVVFSEGREVTSSGVQAATASQNFSSVIASCVATFYASGAGGSGGSGAGSVSTSTFLGSVRVLSSPPAGESRSNSPFLGSVKVISNPPSGLDAAPNPYLGSVVLGSPSSGDSNPTLGEVVIVSGPPAGFEGNDPFLGFIQES